MQRSCTNLTHPRAEDGPVIVRSGLRYIALTCTVCGREQGWRLIRRPRP